LQIVYRELAIEDRIDRPTGVVEIRPWRTSQVPAPDGRTLATWECRCSDVRCHGVFVVDLLRVYQLADRALELGFPIRWRPASADMERSERLQPMNHMRKLPEAAGVLRRLALTMPPALENVRRTRSLHREARL